MTPRLLARLVALGAVLAVSASPAEGQNAEDLFNPGVLQELQLFINARDLNDLHTHYLANTYYPADLHWAGLRVRNVGVRSRGLGSRNGTKLGLHIEFGHFATGQEFLGLKSVELDNLWQDPSMLREHVAMAVFARLGQPAPRVSFARVYVNRVYQGVYGIVETIDAAYLGRTLGDTNGFLFEYHWIDRYEFTDLGGDMAAIEKRFERRTHRSDPQSVVYAPLAEMIRAINSPDGESWSAGVERYVDLRQFLSHVTVEQFLAEHDGLTGYEGLNNFYLFRPVGSSRHQFLPWDRDHSFQDVNSPILLRAQRNELLRRALAVVELREGYLSMLERCADAVARDGWLEDVVTRAASLIAVAAVEDRLKPYDDRSHEEAVNHLLQFARVRSSVVRAAVAGMRTAGWVTAP